MVTFLTVVAIAALVVGSAVVVAALIRLWR